MPILASSMYVNAYGKAAGVVAVTTGALPLNSSQGTEDTYIVKYNSAGQSLWSARIASSTQDVGYGIATDSTGNVYVVGEYFGTTMTAFNFDGTPLSQVLPNSGNSDVFIVKYNTSGVAQWIARVGTTVQDSGYSIATDLSGNVYVTGRYGSSSTTPATAFNADGTAFAPTLANSGSADTFIVKYNTNGFVQWATRIASTQLDIGFAIATDLSGNVYVTGQGGTGVFVDAYSVGNIAFSPSILNAGNSDAFIVKYDTSGVVQWVTRVASGQNDIGNAMATDSGGNLYITGQSGSNSTVVAYSVGNIAFPSTFGSTGQGDAFIVKYNTNGVVQWFTRVGTTQPDAGRGIAVDSSGGVYVTGNPGANVVMTAFNANDGSAFPQTISSSGGSDVFIVKYNTSGLVQWITKVATVVADTGYGIATDSTGNVYITGYYGTDTTGRPLTAFSAGNIAFTTTLTNTGSSDAFIVKYNTNGVVQWITKMAAAGRDIGYGIATDSGGNIYGTGVFTGTRFSVYGQSLSLFSTIQNAAATGQDVFIVKYNTNGSPQWVATIASTVSDLARGIATDPNGTMYAVGRYGTGQALTAFNSDRTAFPQLISSGGDDIFIVKYNTSGFVQWMTRVTSSGSPRGEAIATDPAGNVYVAGVSGTNATVTAFSVGNIAFSPTLANSNNIDAFIVKYNADGIVQWMARVASLAADVAGAIATDIDSNVYVTGQGGSGTSLTAFSVGNIAFSPTLVNSGGNDAFVVKYNTSGVVQWVTRIASSAEDSGTAIATDSSGNVYVTGGGGSGAVVTAFSVGNIAFSPTLVNSGSNDAFVVKYNTSGVVQWVARVASTQSDVGYGIATDSSGNVYITGQNTSNVVVRAFSSNGVQFPITFTGLNSSAFIVKYNTSGIVQWITQVTSTGAALGFEIKTDSNGNVYVTGYVRSGDVLVFNSDGSTFASTTINGCFVVKYTTNGFCQWLQSIRGPTTTTTEGYGIGVDSFGNSYVIGQSGSGDAIQVYNSDMTPYLFLNSRGNQDAFVVKYSPNATPQWVGVISSPGTDSAFAIATDSNSNVYVTGEIGSGQVMTAVSSNGVAFGTTLANSGNIDAFIVKYNTSGIVQWVARVGSTGIDIAYAIATDSGGNVYVTGQGGLNAAVTAFSSNGVAFGTTLANSGSNDTFLVKYNTSGIVQWVTKIASGVADIGYGIATNSSDDSVYIIGSRASSGILRIFSSNGIEFGNTVPSSTITLTFVVKYDRDGIAQWLGSIGTSSNVGFNVATDLSGNVYITGRAAGTVNIVGSDRVSWGTLGNSGNNDAFIVKFDGNGVVQWATRVASTGSDIGYGIATDSSGNVYVTGQGGSSLTVTAFSVGNIAFSPTLAHSGGGDIFIVKYNTSGVVQWIAKLGSAQTDIGYGITTDSAGNVYITGQAGNAQVLTAFNANGTIFGSASTSVVGGLNTETFVVKYNSSGVVQWISNMSGGALDEGRGIALDPSSNIYVAGRFSTSEFVPSNAVT